MIQAILSRISSVHERLRTNQMQGNVDKLPTVGESFVIVGQSLTEGHTHRVICTTPVKEIRHHPEDGSLEFWTENSHYGLQILDLDAEGNA